MLSPGDIRNKSFEKVRNGYRIEEVQPFLSELAMQIDSLTNERDDLQRKLEILAEKVEQYREDEDSLRAALINAQKLGDSVVRDSKRKAEAIIAQATRKSEEMIADAQTSINRESIALNKMQVEVAKFKSQILSLYKKHIELIQELPYDEADIKNLEGTDVQFVADIGETVEIKPQSVEDTSSEENIELKFSPEGPAGEDDTRQFDSEDDATDEDSTTDDDFAKRRPSRFGTLRFGDDYNLTRRGE